MPVVASRFQPPRVLRNRHLQTLLPVIAAAGMRPAFRRERLELMDGDFLDLDWLEAGHPRLAILCSGLEGHSRDPGMVRLAIAFSRAGWDVLSWCYRGCSGEPNRLARFYHSGATEDLAVVVHHAGTRPTGLVGCSLGGNLVLKFLGEGPLPENILAGVAISAPVDLASTALALDQRPCNRFYLRRLIASLREKIVAKASAIPGSVPVERLAGLHGFEDFDGRFTAPAHGFASAWDYWEKCSARRFLAGLSVPALLLNARDDPFLGPESFPEISARGSDLFFLEMPECGGHLGFGETLLRSYADRRAIEFLGGR